MRDFKPRYKRPDRQKLTNPPKGLVLKRTVGESIIIGEDIVVTVTDISNKAVCLCFDAPSHVEIDRSEVREIKRNSKQ